MVTAPVVHVAPCPTAADAPRLPAAGGGIRVDLDGDGSVDRAVIRYAPRASARCAFFLVYELRGGTLVARVPPGDPQEDVNPASFALANWGGDPSLVLIARVRPGMLDAVIRMGHGASSTIFELFGIVDGRLRPVLSYWTGGFVTQGSTGWGCGHAGDVVRRWVGPTHWNGTTYLSNGYEEGRYALRGGKYVRVGVRRDSDISQSERGQRSSVWLEAVLGRESVGFGNCAVKYA
jgi:hypothetical protein